MRMQLQSSSAAQRTLDLHQSRRSQCFGRFGRIDNIMLYDLSIAVAKHTWSVMSKTSISTRMLGPHIPYVDTIFEPLQR